MISRNHQSGATLLELIAVIALASAVLATTVTYSLPMIARETLRGALQEGQAFAQLAKIEAVSRNHACRFVVDTGTGALEVWDSLGTASIDDDVLLHHGRIQQSVRFDRPDSGADVTLEQIGSSSRYQAVFRSDGMVAAGTGEVHLLGGERFGRLAIFAGGGVETAQWSGSQWKTGG